MTTLQKKLDSFADKIMPNIPADAKAIIRSCNEELNAELPTRDMIKVGDKLPSFSLKNQSGRTVNSDELLRGGPLVISFFRGVWCPFCNIELQALEEYAEKFREIGARIVVISPQSQRFAKRSVEENNISFDVLSDMGNQYAKSLNTAFTLPENLKQTYKGFGINLPDYNGDDDWSLPIPARLVVATDGTVLAVDVNPDYTQRPEPSDTLDVLR
ncbi:MULTISPECIES: peroxiredoxin-like family protein [Idiomarina]|uniref:peroxiredoxin-like family protein n=1 Tax=Idiomarina TaxID=135575 RepID=UPI000C560D64|nr:MULTISPECIES: peroxiredoxin-like family protein [Idiomarina]MBP58579.1 alkyl hydroperoxide reductase [Idiomarina sp.]|tara:strand:+ start:2340 stop:2981 length:642 start_codon:yes stop_codon:yes gene_type:complete